MMSPRAWQGAPRRLIGSFVLVLFAPAAAVVWLGARLIEQDRAIAGNQLRDRRASAADLFVAGLSQALSATERQLGETPASLVIHPDDDAVLVTLEGEAVVAYPPDRLPYLPVLRSAAPEPEDEFRAAEALEFRDRNYRGAAGAYRRLTRSGTPALRAGALLRLARVLKQSGRADDALRVYADLALLGEARVAGLPADLVARRARVVLLQETGRTETFAKEVRLLQGDLRAGRWPIDGGTFFAYSDQLRRWSGVEPAGRPEPLALAAAVDWLWQQRIDMEQSDVSASGRHALEFDGVSVCLLWRAVGDRLVVLAAGPRFQHREWFAGPEAAVDARRLRVSLAGSDGRPALGKFADPAAAATERREASATRLPWTVFIEAQDPAGDLAEIAGRRRTLLAGFALLVGLVLAGGYFIARAVSREFAVAQLQSDFVSAVSHEFRTPLTSLAQFTDLLNDDPDLPAAKRRTFYQAQARATERLRRLVESLLDFGRMEAGARPYRLERLAVGPLVAKIVDDFRHDAAPEGFTIESSMDIQGMEAEVDPDAFTRALWNLLDNAVKYSGTSRVVSVTARAQGGAIAISVRDRGLGIPSHEQQQIFGKFVRGAATQTFGIKGTGIGLAMVRHIVEAHRGTVRVESTPGEGSTFTIDVPLKSQVATAQVRSAQVTCLEPKAHSPKSKA